MTNKEREEMYVKIEKHGNNLIKIFGLKNENAILLCKKLRILENKATRLTIADCNADVPMINEQLIYILKLVDKILHFTTSKIPVFINRDPRGYALKINENYIHDKKLVIEKDWGGYGLIAPNFTPKLKKGRA